MNVQRGPWVRKQSLGSGGFGTVWLWHNETTDEKLAVKECQLNNTSERTMMWWKAEVEIMGRLQHENLIRAMPVPAELAPQPPQPPVLAMEFCKGGDLRKVLNLPQNCFGLPEVEIRQLASGVGSALNYLHSHRIIHRDLKPENIVLQPAEGKVLYKIIDLGYAKELDINSLANSFVGTIMYLAPELLLSKPYTKAVDYWSFGVVIYECITGIRPFLPTTPPVEWHRQISKKSPEDISAHLNDKAEVVFSKKLPSRIHLCKPLRGYFEQRLRLMLRWYPKPRGEVNCFALLEQVLKVQIFNILHVETNSLLSYIVNSEIRIEDVNELIQTETGIPVDQQCIVLASGSKLNPSEAVPLECLDPYSEVLTVFLFRAGPMVIPQRNNGNLPSNVNAIVKEPTVLLAPKDHRKAWAEAVYWFTEENKAYERLLLAHGAALLNFNLDYTLLLRQKSDMESETYQLMGLKEFFKASLEFDINKGKETMAVSSDLTDAGGLRLVQIWSDTLNRRLGELDSLFSQVEQVKRLGERVSQMNAVIELQRKPGAIQTNELKEFLKKAREKYEEFLENYQGQDIIQHHDMVNLVVKCFIRRDELTKVLYSHINTIRGYQSELGPIFKQLEKTRLGIREAREQLLILQRQRQETMWSIIGNPQQQQRMGVGELPSMAPLPTMTSTSTLGLESLQLMEDCRQYTQRSKSILMEVMKEQEEYMGYFSSLESNQ